MCAYAGALAHALGYAGKSKGEPVRSRQHTHRESSFHVQANRNRSSFGFPPHHPRMRDLAHSARLVSALTLQPGFEARRTDMYTML